MVHSSQSTVHSDTIGVVLLNLGGPDSIQAVRPFLYNLFSDRKIIQLGPPFLQKPLARLIAMLRYKKTESYYRLIGGRSPILDITTAQAKALEASLTKESISKNTFTVIPACRESFSEEGLRTSRNDNLRGFINDRISNSQLSTLNSQLFLGFSLECVTRIL